MSEGQDPKTEARRKLYGRLMILAMGALLAAYIAVTFFR